MSVFEVDIWDVSCQQWKKCKLANGFALGAFSRPKFLGSHNRTNLKFFFHGNSHLVEDLKNYN
jgi:hypothetical protein